MSWGSPYRWGEACEGVCAAARAGIESRPALTASPSQTGPHNAICRCAVRTGERAAAGVRGGRAGLSAGNRVAPVRTRAPSARAGTAAPGARRAFSRDRRRLPGRRRERPCRGGLLDRRAGARTPTRWRAKCGLDRASLVGISMGGFIALELAIAHPAFVDRLVLVVTSAGGAAHVSTSLGGHARVHARRRGRRVRCRAHGACARWWRDRASPSVNPTAIDEFVQDRASPSDDGGCLPAPARRLPRT